MQTFNEFKDLFGDKSAQRLAKADQLLKASLERFGYRSEIAGGSLNAEVNKDKVSLAQFQHAVRIAMREAALGGYAANFGSSKSRPVHVLQITKRK